MYCDSSHFNMSFFCVASSLVYDDIFLSFELSVVILLKHSEFLSLFPFYVFWVCRWFYYFLHQDTHNSCFFFYYYIVLLSKRCKIYSTIKCTSEKYQQAISSLTMTTYFLAQLKNMFMENSKQRHFFFFLKWYASFHHIKLNFL